MKKILVIDRDSGFSESLRARLGKGIDLLAAESVREGLSLLENDSPDLVILDITPGCSGGLKGFEEIRARDEQINIIVVAGSEEMEVTINAIKKGAFDCLIKPVDLDELELSIKKVFKTIELHAKLKDVVDISREHKTDTIIGKSRIMEEIFKTIGIASQSKVTILIQGESGTGKELIARAIHYNGPERDKPFMAINCSALVETLLESELFGHEKGAFTGALFKKEGKFEAASGGTVFLDEIGEMSQALQVKLLRVLQERSFERVGGSETIKTDVRVIAATNKDLKEFTAKGGFREDLYYRLKVITIDVPPLRERKSDIPALVTYLMDKANRELHKKVRKVPDNIMELMMDYQWPGNVRELENVITRGVLLAKGDVLLDVFLQPEANPETKAEWHPSTMPDVEREHIEKTLCYTNWNKSRASYLLGMSLPRLERKIKKYNIGPDARLLKSIN
ncbi:MAG: sigma-54-dependent Fis family transcriptional regulator [Deltaproteobacteria bacterium]|nr:sigma-54-dependent Fis family transcriptional regulator [Deltaproteobacteria bacterium]